MLASMLLLSLAAHAQAGIPLDPPIPVRGDPSTVVATAWDLPPQKPSYLTQDVAELRCPVQVTVMADGGHLGTADDCPDSMRADALDATARWAFSSPADAVLPTVATLVYVVKYNDLLGAMTLHAELDPGAQAAQAGVEGRPGLRLVHEAELTAPLLRKLPGKARKAGLEDTTCRLRARVTAGGRASEVLVEDCPPLLAHDAQKRVLKARYSPTMIDGSAQEDVIDVTVTYQR